MDNTMLLRAIFAVGGLLLCGVEARAACQASSVAFSIETNPTRNQTMTIDQSGCVYTFSGGLQVSYESITVVQRPKHMTITPTSNGFGYTIAIRNGYRGKDRYVVKACGRNSFGKGCVTITTDVTIS